MAKLIDIEHAYRGYGGAEGAVCRIEVYITPGRPPLVVATELLKNTGTSVTNMAEYLAAEVLERYLTSELMEGFDPPFVWLERYERDPRSRKGEYSHDHDLVTFRHYRREQTLREVRPPGLRYKIGEADWHPLSLEQFEEMLRVYEGSDGTDPE